MEKIKHVNIKNVCVHYYLYYLVSLLSRVSSSRLKDRQRPLCLVTRLSHALRALGDRVGLSETCASIISGGCAGHL